MIEVPVYVPAPKGEGRGLRMGQALSETVAPKSAIVGRPDPDPDLLPDMVVVYYEGNVHNAVNIVTFADRAMHAYWRMRDRYPTTAMMAVPLSQIDRVATLYPEHGLIEIPSGIERYKLGRWLDLEQDVLSAVAGLRFRGELLVSGVRPDTSLT